MDSDFAYFHNRSSIQASGKELLSLDDYQKFTQLTDKNERRGFDGLSFTLLGLYGETGSLLSELKKKQRDKESYIAYHESVLEEFGDVLWYFANTASRAQLSLSTLAQRVSAETEDWSSTNSLDITTFLDLQNEQKLKVSLPDVRLEQKLILLAGKVGHLLEDFSLGRLRNNSDMFSGRLVEIFRALIAAADDACINLSEVADKNISKIIGRWPLEQRWGSLFDENFDEDEQLPRKIIITFKEKSMGKKKYVILKCGGVNIGDRLTDNMFAEDDYRFHDVFHLAYAAILGWSPVLRALLKVKRKSDPKIDENEDGARAILIEEGISTWIFNHGTRNNKFQDLTSLDYTLLKAVQELIKGYEVEARPTWQWEHAILEGFRVFRELSAHRGGTVSADLRTHTISFDPTQ
jgi:NTP pyrophosphatase (non-canonical NTP hydrolase)